MRAEKNISPKLLFQLKLALEKIYNPNDVLIFSGNGKSNTVTPLRKMRTTKDKFEKLRGTCFDKKFYIFK